MLYTVIGMSGLVSLMSNWDTEIGWLRDGVQQVRRTGDDKKTWSDCGSLSVLRLQVTSGPY